MTVVVVFLGLLALSVTQEPSSEDVQYLQMRRIALCHSIENPLQPRKMLFKKSFKDLTPMINNATSTSFTQSQSRSASQKSPNSKSSRYLLPHLVLR